MVLYFSIISYIKIFYKGQERFHSLSKLYVRNALGCIIVSDVTSEISLNSALTWKQIVEENSEMNNGEHIELVLMQNKIDMLGSLGKNEVFQTNEFLQEFSKRNNFNAAFQVSAKLNMNLKNAIDKLVEQILKKNVFLMSYINLEMKKSRSATLRLSSFSQKEESKTQIENKRKCCY